MDSPQANLFNSILERLKLKVPALRYIDQDLGQLENYETRPAVSWPCSLIDIEETIFTDANAELIQIGVGAVMIRTAMVKYTESNNLVPDNIRPNALQYYELENEIYKALHGWAPAGFGKLMRVTTVTERREDDIRVRITKFSYSYTDSSAKPARTRVTVPNPNIHGSTTTTT